MMEIIKCKCGYYKKLDDELCPKCGADYSAGAEYEILDDQETAYMRWDNLGEKGFNQYMESINKPHYMICPECRFKMLVTETECPKCGLRVKYKGNSTKMYSGLERFFTGYLKLYIYGFAAIVIFFILVLIYSYLF